MTQIGITGRNKKLHAIQKLECQVNDFKPIKKLPARPIKNTFKHNSFNLRYLCDFLTNSKNHYINMQKYTMCY